MIFNFLKYLSPIWYFNLRPAKDHCYFPSPSQIQAMGEKFPFDKGFESKEAQERDLAYRAFQIGLIYMEEGEAGIDVWSRIAIPIQDEYRFIRKNFNLAWGLYILMFRLITFHNPITEIRAFWRTRNVKRIKYTKSTLVNDQYERFQSPLLLEQPLISVIIPTLNRYKYLKDVFKDLERQTYKNFEVIVVDQTDPFQEEVYEGWNLNLKFWYQEEKALWKARNDAIRAAKGEYILLYDDDSLVEENWIEQHVKAIDFFKADISSGVSLSKVGGSIPQHYAYFRWSDQLDTGNVLLKRIIFEQIGLFDRQFEKQRMGDGEYGLRAYLKGFKKCFKPKIQENPFKGRTRRVATNGELGCI